MLPPKNEFRRPPPKKGTGDLSPSLLLLSAWVFAALKNPIPSVSPIKEFRRLDNPVAPPCGTATAMLMGILLSPAEVLKLFVSSKLSRRLFDAGTLDDGAAVAVLLAEVAGAVVLGAIS